MISKELLSEVLSLPSARVSINDVFSNDLEYMFDYKHFKVNTYELAHKCKEWAILNNCNITIFMRIPDIYIHLRTIDYGYSINHSEETWWNYSEPETIFKACQWILDNKETK